MSPRFYSRLWFVFVASIAVIWLMGSLTMFTLVVFGFIAFGMIFTGMMCVLPAAVGPHAQDVSGPGISRSFLRSIGARIHGVSHRWFNPAGVEIRRPRFH